MAVKLEKALEREIRVYGVEGPVVVTITPTDINFRIPGSRTPVTASWPDVIQRGTRTLENVPSYLMGKPLEFLQHQAREVTKRRAKKESKGE